MTGAVRILDDDLLLIVDVQNDFCPGGALAVSEGNRVVPVINNLVRIFPHVILTQDWHSPKHSSFASSHPGMNPFETVKLSYGSQVLWADHCVRGSKGAELHPDLHTVSAELVLRKGLNPNIDSYSAFTENDRTTPTGLEGYLRERGLERLFLAGLATDFCVCYSALDGRKLGFDVFVVEDACRGIDLNGSLDAAWRAMEKAGVRRIMEEDIERSVFA